MSDTSKKEQTARAQKEIAQSYKADEQTKLRAIALAAGEEKPAESKALESVSIAYAEKRVAAFQLFLSIVQRWKAYADLMPLWTIISVALGFNDKQKETRGCYATQLTLLSKVYNRPKAITDRATEIVGKTSRANILKVAREDKLVGKLLSSARKSPTKTKAADLTSKLRLVVDTLNSLTAEKITLETWDLILKCRSDVDRIFDMLRDTARSKVGVANTLTTVSAPIPKPQVDAIARAVSQGVKLTEPKPEPTKGEIAEAQKAKRLADVTSGKAPNMGAISKALAKNRMANGKRVPRKAQ